MVAQAIVQKIFIEFNWLMVEMRCTQSNLCLNYFSVILSYE